MNIHGPKTSDDDIAERYPHYKTYKRCQSKAFMTGMVTLAGVAGSTFIIMEHWFQKFKPNIGKQWLLAGPFMAGIVSSYVVTMRQTVNCQNMWMAMEERHSAITTAEERLKMRIEEDKDE